jgi:dTDP-4-amino-4,6-dideoxygalactose transaminase
MPEIPAIDLKQQYQRIHSEIDAAIARTFERGSFILGAEVAAFEQEFAAYCGVAFGIGVSSGTSALQIALLAAGIGVGDEVITSAHTSVATVSAIEQAGARPVLVDIDLARYTLDPARFTAAMTPRTRAVIPVHLYGCPADLAPIIEIAHARGLLVIEDCAQAHGALYRGRWVGSWGDMAAFSFYPTKNLGAYGDGGALLTNDPALAGRARQIREYGWQERNFSVIKGLNSRLDELQAAVLRVKLKYLDQWNERRRVLTDLYDHSLASAGLVLPLWPADCTPVFHQYVIRHPHRDDLKAFLAQRDIQTQVHYPTPVHLQPAYAGLGYQAGDLPNCEIAARQVLSLPLYPELSDEAVKEVCCAIGDFLESANKR